MKSPDEIKKGLTCVCDSPECEDCAYATKVEDKEFGEILQFHCSEIYKDAYDLIILLESRLAQAERERDVAVQTVHGLCHHCKNNRSEKCRKCLFWPSRVYFVSTETYVDHWEWRGVCEENTKEE